MKKISIAIIALCVLSINSFGWVYYEGKISDIWTNATAGYEKNIGFYVNATNPTRTLLFAVDATASEDAKKRIMAVVLAAQQSGNTVRIYGGDAAVVDLNMYGPPYMKAYPLASIAIVPIN